MMRKSIIAFIAIITIGLGTIMYYGPSLAEKANFKPTNDTSKEEVVYVNLDAEGGVKYINVVNILDIDSASEFKEYGDYKRIENLTNEDEIVLDGNRVMVKANTPERLYYQGEMQENKFPWDLTISYSLDGLRLSPDDILGKSGKVKIKIKSSRDTSFDESFYESFALQIDIPLDARKFTGIKADDGMFVNVGQDRQISYTILPGNDADISIEANVKDFEMDNISIAAIPFSFIIDDLGDIEEDIDDLKSGVKELSDGMNLVASGSSRFENGIGQLSTAGAELTQASTKIDDALADISLGLSSGLAGDDESIDLSSLAELPEALGKIADGLDGIASTLKNEIYEYEKAKKTLSAVMDSIPEGDISQEEFNSLLEANPDNRALNLLIDIYKQSMGAKKVYSGLTDKFDKVTENYGMVIYAIKDVNKNIDKISSAIDVDFESSDSLDSLADLIDAIENLSTNYGKFDKGLQNYISGVNKVSGNYSDIDSGIGELAQGATSMKENLNSMDIQEYLDEFDNSDFIPISFASKKNGEIAAVQFLIQTDSIKKEEEIEKIPKEEKTTFWDRLGAIFT